ncbi:hypothetical protein GLYMA_05G166000v4 [Glycine max]|uniref:Uncharacterized protein n=2 Tax=Glycine subgen. Soja TaxID=1462606 RepID=K7KQN1_SOYBN|nr:uncharacterized protein LOC102662390 [Glycine max]XP_028232943.1 uncharacterized protein LOC114413000 [Glycine soja]KAG5029576.1 hypothetical protein JHK87_013090 [Glycine soja]KAH1134787.1 hypothetical protein GYH30_012888 [Glycine max]KRH59112.1 hypothetical protein GLYMA_05G166000v4 [Glycine max]RZC12787.1 hypothetical protein D0Y65_012512 [Glycine soja]|eukprot:XP_006580211.1 uncharacterized protein LOC102662390 [Glycine max]
MEVVTFALAVFVPLILAGASSARELRPSDHGLTFQTLSPAGAHSSPEMRSFFNSADSSPSMSSSSDVALPRAMDSGDASPPEWWKPDGGHSGEGVGKALTVASLVCGVAGAVLLVASGLIYLFKYRNRNRKQKLNAAFCGENENQGGNDEDKNKLQLVVRNP